MILCVALNPSIDRTLFIESLQVSDTNRVLKTETDAGGKGINVARMLQTLKADVLALAMLGGAEGVMVEHVLNRETVPLEVVALQESTRVNVMIEQLDGAPPTTFNERGPKVSAVERAEFEARFDHHAGSASFVVLGGSLPETFSADSFANLIVRARNCGTARLVVDADGEPMQLALAKKPFLIKPNGAEAGRLLCRSVTSQVEATIAAKKLFEQGAEVALVSMGSLGCALATSAGAFWAAAPKVATKSTIGAGDSLVAGYLHGYEEGKRPEGCLALGVAAGAATAMSDGASIGELSDLLNLVEKVKIERVN